MRTKADMVMDKVAKVWEVQAFLKEHASKKAALLLQREPEKDFKYYWVSMGVSNLDRFRTTENFYVDPKTLEVFYLDIHTSKGSDEILTLKHWRHLRHSPGWNKPHYYNKAGKLIVDTEK